jgi:quinoprotein glucose dehydrogenase
MENHTMSTDGALSRSRLLPSLIGIVLLLMGLALLAGGIKLSMLGGSQYYLLAGIGLLATGVLLLAARRSALGMYALVLFISTGWALGEVGLDWWQLVPRLALFFALGIVLLLPSVRRPLHRGEFNPIGTGALSVAVAIAGIIALASLFTHPGEVEGQLDRDAVPGMTNTAPAMPDGDWNSYGRSAYGDRYSPLAQITPENVNTLVPPWAERPGGDHRREHPAQSQRHALCLHAPQPGDRAGPGHRQGNLAFRSEAEHAECGELQGLGAHDLPWRVVSR